MRLRIIPGSHKRYASQETVIGLFMIAIVLAIVGWSLPLVSTSDPITSNQCLVNYYAFNVTETNGTIALYCSQVGYTQLTGYPSPCPTNQYVFAIGVSLSCTTIQWANITNFPSGCPGGQFVTNIGSSITCAIPPPDPNSSVKCTSGQFVSNVTESSGALTIICSLVPWSSLTSFPSGCSAGSFVVSIGATLTCGTPSQEASATAQCTSGQFAFNVTEAVGGSFTLGCSKINWSSLQNFPSGCSADSFVTAVGSTLTCATPAQEVANSVKCTTSGQFVTNVTETSGGVHSVVCAYPDWTKLVSFPSACSAGQYVSAVGVTLTCSAVGWTQLTGFPSACATGQFVTAVGSSLTCSFLAFGDYLTNLVGYWKLNEGSGTTATDSSSTGDNGVISGDYTWLTTSSACNNIFSTCLKFGGTSAQINITDNAAYTITAGQSFTVSYWLWTNSTPTQEDIFVKTNVAATNEWVVRIGTSQNIRMQLFDGTNQARSSWTATYGSTNIANNKWHWIVNSYNAKSGIISVYVDGQMFTTVNNVYSQIAVSANSSCNATACNVFVGRGVLSGGFYTGVLAELRIYKQFLSQQIIDEQYAYYNNLYGLTP